MYYKFHQKVSWGINLKTSQRTDKIILMEGQKSGGKLKGTLFFSFECIHTSSHLKL